jgi:hypothetical protein
MTRRLRDGHHPGGATRPQREGAATYDNAVAESFFASLKAEWVDHQDYATHDTGHASLGEYIDRFYNPTRRHSHLGYVSPIEFELRWVRLFSGRGNRREIDHLTRRNRALGGGSGSGVFPSS